MTFGLDDAERAHLLHLELETSWVLDHDGRIVRSTAPVVPHEPLLVIAAHPAAQVWAASARVPAGSVDDLAVVIAKGERRDLVGWAPAGATEILETLRGAGLGQIAAPMGGLCGWCVPREAGRASTPSCARATTSTSTVCAAACPSATGSSPRHGSSLWSTARWPRCARAPDPHRGRWRQACGPTNHTAVEGSGRR